VLHGRGSTQGTELCTIVELLASFERVLEIGGEPWVADAIERVAYNALPAILSPDHCGHQYFELPNQVACTPGAQGFWVQHGNDLLFGPLSGYGCCAANLHMGWPLLVNHLWLAVADGGLAAMILAPCVARARIGGARVSIVEETDYPFGDEVRFTVRTSRPIEFPLTIRVPRWAGRARVTVNGRGAQSARGPLVRVRRTWREGDTVVLRLAVRVRVSRWERGSVGVERGPLVYALRIGEEWRKVSGTEPFADYELHATTPWNYGLLLDPSAPARSVRFRRGPMGAQPWAQDGSPVRLVARGKRIPAWEMVNGTSGPIPAAGLEPDTPREALTLVPYGCARLRIAMFPLVR
jgi:uncharacterized protein